jgi:hypothetical protein
MQNLEGIISPCSMYCKQLEKSAYEQTKESNLGDSPGCVRKMRWIGTLDMNMQYRIKQGMLTMKYPINKNLFIYIYIYNSILLCGYVVVSKQTAKKCSKTRWRHKYFSIVSQHCKIMKLCLIGFNILVCGASASINRNNLRRFLQPPAGGRPPPCGGT